MLIAVLSGLLGYRTYRYSAVTILARANGDREPQVAMEVAPLLQARLRDLNVLQAVARDCGIASKAENLASAVTVQTGTATGSIEVFVRLSNSTEAVALAKALGVKALSIASELVAVPNRTMIPLYEKKLVEAETQLKSSSERLIALEQEQGSGERNNTLEEYSKHREELETKLVENESLSRALGLQVKNLQGDIAAHHPAVLSAKQALDKALLRYTEDHPKAEELKLTLAAVQARVRDQKDEVDPEIALNGSSLAQNLYAKFVSVRSDEKLLDAKKQEMLVALNRLTQKIQSLPQTQVRYARAKADYQLWNNAYQQTLGELNKQQLLASTARVPFTLQATPANPSEPAVQRWSFALLVAIGGSILGSMGLSFGLAWQTCRDPRIQSETELHFATSLPLLGTLPNLKTMALEEQEKWAFHTFSEMKAKLAPESGAALVCGFTSSRQGEGRSTWIRLLAGTARKQGYQVLVVATVPTLSSENRKEHQSDCGITEGMPSVTLFDESHPVRLTTESFSQVQAFAMPAQAAWSLENRLQWQQGIHELRKVPNRVILVEFPPASEPETVLLAQNFPNLIWVCGQDMVTGTEIQNQMKSLNVSQAKLVGTVLNFAQA
jgi:capsular polysaccharide biosynthesis protein